MDLTPDPEQQLLVESARRFLDRHCPFSVVRRIEASAHGHDPELWKRAAELGWPGLVVPPDFGGSGQGALELALVARELGRAAYTSPLVTSTTLVTFPLLWSDEGATSARWLAGLASGSVIGAAALMADHVDERSSLSAAAALRGVSRGPGWEIRGRRTLVPFLAMADVVLVLTMLEGVGPALVLVTRDEAVREVRRLSVLGADPLYDVAIEATVREDDVAFRGDAAVRVLHRALDHATVVSTAYAAGLGARALELSVEHARNREQFGQPIGSFQAVAHRCADMRADIDAIELLAFQAAWMLDHDPASDLAVGAAKGYASDAIRRVFLHAHQVHGAIGFTMEHDLQLLTRRAKSFELALGSADRHRERVAKAMGL